MNLNIKALVLTAAILWATAVLLTGLANLIWAGNSPDLSDHLRQKKKRKCLACLCRQAKQPLPIWETPLPGGNWQGKVLLKNRIYPWLRCQVGRMISGFTPLDNPIARGGR